MIQKTKSNVKSTPVSAVKQGVQAQDSPDHLLGQLFADVQHSHIYGDSKLFADFIPKRRVQEILKEYELAKKDPSFDLREFVGRHFHPAGYQGSGIYVTDPNMGPREHIRQLWAVLERKADKDMGSLVSLPKPYVVPGGRFAEQFYWDSYFIMLGLAADDRWDMVENMVDNVAYMIKKYGFMPNANRTYALSRSQPPFFSRMVKLLAKNKGPSVIAKYLPQLITEHRFWMHGANALDNTEHGAFVRVVEMPDRTLLNRYYDNKTTPRPESLYEDTNTAGSALDKDPDRLFLHLRAGAESGWDFSSRWLSDPMDVSTIHTADIVPVDLNSLLYLLEETIVEGYRISGRLDLARRFHELAQKRAKAVRKYCWSEKSGFFIDYDFHQKESLDRITLAAVFPLYAKIASSKQALAVARRIKRDFLKSGGLVSTLIESGQQWDAPNGWAPLQWVAIEGLRNYGYHALASEIKRRWVDLNLEVYELRHKMVEKYNVIGGDGLGGGGEYPLQDGFGWTNGVLAALLDE